LNKKVYGCPIFFVFGDNMMTVAAIDRLVHHSDIYKIQGDSYRKKQAMKTRSSTGQAN
jgi:DNA replication protein DnaC